MEKEVWKPIKGFEGFYEVSSLGRVRSCPRTISNPALPAGTQRRKGQILRPNKTYRGYYIVHLSRQGSHAQPSIHRLVAEAFLPNPKHLPQVNHKNGVPTDNRAENLEWCSAHYNMHHACYVLGHNVRPVYAVEIDTIFPSVREAARRFGVNHSCIIRAIRRRARCCNLHWRYHKQA